MLIKLQTVYKDKNLHNIYNNIMKNKHFSKHHNKYENDICSSEMNFQECELAILRQAIDESEKIQGEKMVNSDIVQQIINILEEFLRNHKCICYGGTAINNILPKEAQFYNRDIEIPDYDFYSKTPMEYAIKLADLYYKEGFTEVEAKAGMHYGTYKVFVNFIPIADITLLHEEIFDSIYDDSIIMDGIYYCPANFLRMNMFLELSRPAGDVSRWEKIFKRLTLLNKYYPFNPEIPCAKIDFEKKYDSNIEDSKQLYYIIRDSFIDQDVIFFGGYATSLYSKYSSDDEQNKMRSIPDFDVISEDPEKCAVIVVEKLINNNFKKVKTVVHDGVGEIIPKHIEIKVDNHTLAYIYYPIACHNYNIIHINNRKVKIATIDTILSFYLAFYYSKKPYYQKDRIICMAKFLFDLEQHNRLTNKGIFKRFSIECMGKQPTLAMIRSEKSEKFHELKKSRDSDEYNRWFLNYKPHAIVKVKKNPNEKKIESLYLSSISARIDEPTKKEIYEKISESIKNIKSFSDSTKTKTKTKTKSKSTTKKSSLKSKTNSKTMRSHSK